MNGNILQLVVEQEGKVVTDSLKIAEAFKKRHADVLRSINSLKCSEEFRESNFALVDYTDAKGELRPKYHNSIYPIVK